MKRFKTHLILAAVFAAFAFTGTMMKPHSASAATATSSPVQIVPNNPFGETESGGFGLPTGITVPANKYLTIETVSIQLDVTPAANQIEAFVNYTSGGNNVSLFVPLTFAYSQPSNDYGTYVATQAVRLYADPGTTVGLTAYSPGGSTGTTFLTLSGYLTQR